MTDLDDLRSRALALPETSESLHFRLPCWRVRDAVFALVQPGGTHALVFLDEVTVSTLAGQEPGLFEAVWKGLRPVGVRVELAALPAARVGALLRAAWRSRAPKRLLDQASRLVDA